MVILPSLPFFIQFFVSITPRKAYSWSHSIRQAALVSESDQINTVWLNPLLLKPLDLHSGASLLRELDCTIRPHAGEGEVHAGTFWERSKYL